MYQVSSIKSPKIKSFTDLHAWQAGHALVLGIYKAIANFPPEEKFGLSNQLRRAAVSITSNIAEGFSRQSRKEKVQFYSIAHGSLSEVQNQLLIARDVKLIPEQLFDRLAKDSVQVHKLISGLMKSATSKGEGSHT